MTLDLDCGLGGAGRFPKRGGLEERMPVLDVGAGVGYLKKADAVACRFDGLGRPGDEERGSNAGSKEGAGRFTPWRVGSEGSRVLVRAEGEESIVRVVLILVGSRLDRDRFTE